MEINPSCALDLYTKYDHVLLESMLDMQMQMRTPPEEREQENRNIEFKEKLQKLVDSQAELVWGDQIKTYEDMVVEAQKSKIIETKVVSPEIQAKLLTGQELTQEELASLR